MQALRRDSGPRLRDGHLDPPPEYATPSGVGPIVAVLWGADEGTGMFDPALTSRATPVGIRIMADLNDEISAYDGMRSDLETKYLGKWALVHDQALIGTYETFEAAANEAVQRFGRGPYLIRQIGAPPGLCAISSASWR
jgi:hypothetical protein